LSIAIIKDDFTQLKQTMKSEDDENLEGRLNHDHCCDLEEMGTKHQHRMLFFHGRGTHQWKLDVGVPLNQIFEPGSKQRQDGDQEGDRDSNGKQQGFVEERRKMKC